MLGELYLSWKENLHNDLSRWAVRPISQPRKQNQEVQRFSKPHTRLKRQHHILNTGSSASSSLLATTAVKTLKIFGVFFKKNSNIDTIRHIKNVSVDYSENTAHSLALHMPRPCSWTLWVHAPTNQLNYLQENTFQTPKLNLEQLSCILGTCYICLLTKQIQGWLLYAAVTWSKIFIV